MVSLSIQNFNSKPEEKKKTILKASIPTQNMSMFYKALYKSQNILYNPSLGWLIKDCPCGVIND